MTRTDGAPPAALPVVRAAVTAGPVETLYWRSGSGATTVIVLRGDAHHDTRDDVELVRLAVHCRLVVPEQVNVGALAGHRRYGESSLATWLCDFAEGLGLHHAHVVATAEYAVDLLRLAVLHGERFGHLVCLGTPRPAAAAFRDAGTDGGRISYVPSTGGWAGDVLALLHAPQGAAH